MESNTKENTQISSRMANSQSNHPSIYLPTLDIFFQIYPPTTDRSTEREALHHCQGSLISKIMRSSPASHSQKNRKIRTHSTNMDGNSVAAPKIVGKLAKLSPPSLPILCYAHKTAQHPSPHGYPAKGGYVAMLRVCQVAIPASRATSTSSLHPKGPRDKITGQEIRCCGSEMFSSFHIRVVAVLIKC